jgi:hypothetical protein
MTKDRDAQVEEWYQQKLRTMERLLGKAHEQTVHYIVSDGPLCCLFSFPNLPKGMPGTAVASGELSEHSQAGPANRVSTTMNWPCSPDFRFV